MASWISAAVLPRLNLLDKTGSVPVNVIDSEGATKFLIPMSSSNAAILLSRKKTSAHSKLHASGPVSQKWFHLTSDKKINYLVGITDQLQDTQ